ncbi:DNA-binding protein [Methylobacter sp. BlB1]|uniref:DNA-binding protein n=1 Tax=Methylobacter sp. BlB1 TaxID=2785914 RepID=UPI001894D832|nr:DNA-binding protein [Methylobacter sp. BlB1]MBF6649119.1 DNA-binding protein [Methylobacter sp. BlB1]
MKKNTDTYSLAYECCDQVFLEEGRFPTIDAIRERIHINSPAVIKRAMNDWTLHFVDKHRRKLEHPKMPAALVDAAESLWQLALQQAQAAYGERQAALDRKEADWQSRLQALEQARADQELAWQQEAGRMAQELTAQADVVLELSGQLGTTAARLENTEQWLAESRQDLSRAQGALAEARAANETQAREWTIKFEKDHEWHLRRIEEEKDLLKKRQAKALADQKRALELAQIDQEALRIRLTQIMHQVGDSLERQNKLEAENAALREQLAQAEQALASEREKAKKLSSLVKKQRRRPARLTAERAS